MNTSNGNERLRVAIIGSGFSGLCLGIQLKKAGIRSFHIFEKADRVGGTWRDNTYPGAACDSPSIAYCFSFEQKGDWSRKWSPQAEILEYMEHCAEKYGLLPHIQFGTEVTRAHFDESEGAWIIQTEDGRETRADILVSAVGQLNRPLTPDIRGRDQFEGDSFHSASWDHDIALEGRSVSVIGNAASAVQFVPEIAPKVDRLTIYQRSANWMLPKNDIVYTPRQKEVLTRYPLLTRLYRWWLWATYEARFPMFIGNRLVATKAQEMAERPIRRRISDPALQEALVPDYPIGGKRILISDDYYPALDRDNVDVITSPIDHIEARCVVTEDGESHPADVLIYATGFESTSFLAPMNIVGLGQRSLETEWKDGARAYLGMTVSGFPNFFMMYGPNTNLGHNSIVFMIECQTRYILQCIETMKKRDIQSIDLDPQALESYNRRLQRDLARTVWSQTGKSWYKTDDGKITNNWSGTTIAYWLRTLHASLRPYRIVQRGR